MLHSKANPKSAHPKFSHAWWAEVLKRKPQYPLNRPDGPSRKTREEYADGIPERTLQRAKKVGTGASRETYVIFGLAIKYAYNTGNYGNQSEQEYRVWQSCPHDLKEHLAPILWFNGFNVTVMPAMLTAAQAKARLGYVDQDWYFLDEHFRDVHDENVMWHPEDGRPVLVDYGLGTFDGGEYCSCDDCRIERERNKTPPSGKRWCSYNDGWTFVTGTDEVRTKNRHGWPVRRDKRITEYTPHDWGYCTDPNQRQLFANDHKGFFFGSFTRRWGADL